MPTLPKLTPDFDQELMNVSNEIVLDIDKYESVFFHHPTTEEVRASFRNPANKKIDQVLIDEGVLDASYNAVPDYTTIRSLAVDDENENLIKNKIGNKGL